MNFIKANWWKFLLMIVVVWAAVTGYNILRDYLFNAGMAAAKADYDALQAEADAKLVAKNAEYVALIGKAEKDRQDAKAQHEAEKRKFQKDIGYFKSETALALKAKNATVEQWAAAKTQDEIIIGLATDRIEAQDKQIKTLIADWTQSDIDKDAAHKKIVDDMALKFQRCQEWSDKLEAKAKRKPFAKVIQVAVVVAAFSLGRLVK